MTETPALYLRFGDWPDSEQSLNHAMGWREDGVSVYELDTDGNPIDPDADFSRCHEHDATCGPDCDLDEWNANYGNDTREEMQGRVRRAEEGRRMGQDDPRDRAHLVTGVLVGIGHDGEPLLRNVRRVGDWIDHRHLFIPSAQPHRLLARSEDDDRERECLSVPFSVLREIGKSA